jgi:hypothetical protein
LRDRFRGQEREFPRFRKGHHLHIAAAHPLYVQPTMPGALIEAEREIYKGQVKETGSGDEP